MPAGKLEYGAYLQAWDNNVPGKPGERIDDEMQWGLPMEGNSSRIRLWAIFRYVPYIPVRQRAQSGGNS